MEQKELCNILLVWFQNEERNQLAAEALSKKFQPGAFTNINLNSPETWRLKFRKLQANSWQAYYQQETRSFDKDLKM